jgi:tRNA 2-thiouridine synthesizing protein A
MESQDPRCIDCKGLNCPLPLLEVRKAVIKGRKGDIVTITGDHENSKYEIPMALESMKCTLLELKENGSEWTITFRI